jgi:hypothetical protein
MLSAKESSFRSALAVGLAVFVFALVNLVWLNNPHRRPEQYIFSAEHGNIAAALVQRGEFADPFGVPSGPTAWVPPVYPFYMAVVFLVAGVKTTTALWILLIMDCGWMALTVSALAYALHRQGLARAAAWLGALLALQILLIQQFFLLIQSQSWFVAALNATFLACWVAVQQPHSACRWWWGLIILCALAPVTHLGSGLAIFALMLWLAWLGRRPDSPLRGRQRWLVAAFLAFFLTAGIWTLRNRVVLGVFYPVKSNGWFELELAQQYTATGVLSAAAVACRHPFFDPVQRERFSQLKERAYLEDARQAAIAFLRQHPARYFRFLGNRLINALVFTQNSSDCVTCTATVSVDDLIRLQAAGLGARASMWTPFFWTSLQLSPPEMPARLVSAGVAQPRVLYYDWLNAHAAFVANRANPLHILAEFSLSGIPIACLLIYLALTRRQTESVVIAAATVYLLALAPNILVTHDSNQQLLHLGLLSGFTAILVAELHGRLSARRPIPSR